MGNMEFNEVGKILIAGTGRTGTSFLIQLFTYLGMDTGYTINDVDAGINYSRELRPAA